MPMKRFKQAVAANGSYTDKEGNEKTRWVTCGTLFSKDNGDLSLKLDAVPIGTDFEGWINFFDFRDSSEVSTGRSAGTSQSSVDDDEVPF